MLIRLTNFTYTNIIYQVSLEEIAIFELMCRTKMKLYKFHETAEFQIKYLIDRPICFTFYLINLNLHFQSSVNLSLSISCCNNTIIC